ncbi:MAG: HD domain-containing protein [candidate division KSB1 bacterium]|jgi:3'-5' exoribonuclease|nr:HD domain-containing protein [candidate division KSB1 bacterium]
MDQLDQKKISELRPGDRVLGYYVVRKKDVRVRQHNREPYLTFEFGDASGRIRGTIWDDIRELNHTIRISDIVKIKGSVITYRDSRHITIDRIRTCREDEHVNAVELIPESKHDTGEMYRDLLQIIDSLENVHVRRLVSDIYTDDQIAKRIKLAPAAKLMHHSYIGGLLEHTLSVTRICLFLQNHYPTIDRDVLAAGALLHDIGKIEEFSLKGFIDYSTRGRLIGHVEMSARVVTEKIAGIEDFPEDIGDRLIHCILSHHGSRERGSPVVPATLEALIVHYADEVDSRVNAFCRVIEKESEPGREWSSYVNILDRFIYFGR